MKPAIIFLLCTYLVACNSAPPVVNSTKPINSAQQTNDAQSMIAHSSEGSTPKPVNSGGRPGTGEPIDTSKYDTTVAAAEKESKAKPGDAAAKKALAEAYFERGVALTEAKQYASALGDYRRALKVDPNHEESKKWVDQILSIYSMMKRDAPKEGEEPAPLPFKKGA